MFGKKNISYEQSFNRVFLLSIILSALKLHIKVSVTYENFFRFSLRWHFFLKEGGKFLKSLFQQAFWFLGLDHWFPSKTENISFAIQKMTHYKLAYHLKFYRTH